MITHQTEDHLCCKLNRDPTGGLPACVGTCAGLNGMATKGAHNAHEAMHEGLELVSPASIGL